MHAHQPEEMRGETRAPIREVNLQTPHKLGTKVAAPHPAASRRMRDKLGQPCGRPVKIEKKKDVLASPTSLGVSVHPTPTRGPDDTLLLGSSIPKRCYFLSEGREESRRQRSRTDAPDLTTNQSAVRLTSRQSASRKEDEGLHAPPSKLGGSCGRICQASPAKCLQRGSTESQTGRSINTPRD